MIEKKINRRKKIDKSEIISILVLILVMIAIIFSERNLTSVLLLMIGFVLPGGLFLYWLDFKKQNKD